MNNQFCKDCLYYFDNDQKSGRCQVDAPVFHPTKNPNIWGEWPSVQATDWCGKFKQR